MTSLTARLPDPAADSVPPADREPDQPSPDSGPAPRRARDWKLVIGAGVVSLALFAALVWLPVPYVAMSPGPMFNTIGAYDGVELIEVSGTKTFPTTGQLDMTTVSERGGPYGNLTFGELVFGVIDPQRSVVPTELLYPEPLDEDQARRQGQAQFQTSQSNAIAAAMGLLGKPVSAALVVTSVSPGSPAEGKLEPGDELVSVNGTPVDAPLEAVAKIHALTPGDRVVLGVERKGERERVSITTVESTENPGRAFIGITVGVLYSAPFDIQFHLDNVGGPSAGLMFTLGLYDELTPQDLTRGRFIAGTGTISPTGDVGAIGGIAQKMAAAKDAGAELFLAPVANCPQVLDSKPDDLPVAAVETAQEAVDAVRDFTSGKPVPTCEQVRELAALG